MRKIENKSDFIRFSLDFATFTPNYTVGAFALSQDGETRDGEFFGLHKGPGAYDSYFGDKSPEHCDIKATMGEFFRDVTGNYNYPFFICDTGANYKWL